jgi:hypothetical protein
VEAVEAPGRALARALVEGAATLPGVRLLGPVVGPRVALVALALPGGGLDAETVARTVADTGRVLCAAGRRCAHPLHDRLGIGATLRLSAWITNDEADAARAFDALRGLIGSRTLLVRRGCARLARWSRARTVSGRLSAVAPATSIALVLGGGTRCTARRSLGRPRRSRSWSRRSPRST